LFVKFVDQMFKVLQHLMAHAPWKFIDTPGGFHPPG